MAGRLEGKVALINVPQIGIMDAAMAIEARGESGYVRRIFNCAGARVMEKIDRGGIGVERFYDADGITLLSEAIFDSCDDR